MLILTRRIGETLVIGDDIKIHLIGFRNNQVKIGISAPKNRPVHRQEVYDRIQRELKIKAAESN